MVVKIPVIQWERFPWNGVVPYFSVKRKKYNYTVVQPIWNVPGREYPELPAKVAVQIEKRALFCRNQIKIFGHETDAIFQRVLKRSDKN